MKLTEQQIAFYDENGYLLMDAYLSEQEVTTLCTELPATIDKRSPRVVLEDNGSVRSVFAPHFVNAAYERLARLDRLIVPSEQLIRDQVYLHQYKINIKKGLQADWWEWHQDFPYWHIDDGISNPDMISLMIYLQDTDYLNGALMLIPKTHKAGIAKFAHKDPVEMAENLKSNEHHENKEYLSSLNSNIKFTVDHDLIRQLSVVNGIVTASAKKGSVLFFHGNIFHASNSNLTPFDRDAVVITYNSVNNLPCTAGSPRPDFLAGRDYQPIVTLETGI